MRSKKSQVLEKRVNHPIINTYSGVSQIIQYTPPVYKENKAGSYIEFTAFDPARGKMRRKTIKINRVKGVLNRRKYAKEYINRLNIQFQKGWNPWIEGSGGDLATFEEGIGRYETHVEKMMSNGLFRKDTYVGYKSYIKILREFIKTRRPTHYMYQFDRTFCNEFLDWVFIDRNNGAQTRNNYLGFLKVFSGFLVEKGYLQSRPTEGISSISKRLYKKSRTVIPNEVIGELADYCKLHERHFLLACYLLYYCFIRPVEMTRLRVRDFNLKAGTVTIPAECSKNHKEQSVTLPKKVLLYAVELGVFSAPSDNFVFSYNLKPGPIEVDPKHFRDHWDNLRKPLKLRSEWKFYSLKDTGITAMLKAKMPAIDVRDQARHSSLAITEIYTDHTENVNPEIFNFDGAL